MSLIIRQTGQLAFGYQHASEGFQDFKVKLAGLNDRPVKPGQISAETEKAQPAKPSKKFIEGFVDTVDYTKAAIFGTIEGFILGGLTYMGIWGTKLARAGFIQNISTAKNHKPGLIGKTFAIGTGVGTLAYSLFKVHLNINKREKDT